MIQSILFEYRMILQHRMILRSVSNDLYAGGEIKVGEKPPGLVQNPFPA